MSGPAEERGKKSRAADGADPEVQTYEYSGIQERKGKVNGWLIALYVVLTIWGVWYLFAYWTKS